TQSITQRANAEKHASPILISHRDPQAVQPQFGLCKAAAAQVGGHNLNRGKNLLSHYGGILGEYLRRETHVQLYCQASRGEIHVPSTNDTIPSYPSIDVFRRRTRVKILGR